MRCDACGDIEYALMDGYDFGDRILEGVMFRVFSDGHVETDDDWSKHPYLGRLNAAVWLKEAATCAKEADQLECPKCGSDVDV